MHGAGGVVVDGLHPLGVQRAGVLDRLLADRTELRIVGLLRYLGRGFALQHTARQCEVVQLRELVGVGVVELFGFLFRVEVIEVAVELIEAVHRRQVLVLVAEVVLAELAGSVAEWFEQLGDRRVLGGPSDIGTRHSDLAHAGAIHALPADESRPTRGAALLPVRVGEAHALVGDAVDVGGAIAHQAVAVTAEVADPDVVAPDDENVGFAVRHLEPLRLDRLISNELRELDITLTASLTRRLRQAASEI